MTNIPERLRTDLLNSAEMFTMRNYTEDCPQQPEHNVSELNYLSYLNISGASDDICFGYRHIISASILQNHKAFRLKSATRPADGDGSLI
jgi:hypothetical protein